MQKYKNYLEYFDANYNNQLVDILTDYLPFHFVNNYEDGIEINDVQCKVYSVTTEEIVFTKSEQNKVEFDTHIRVKYHLFLNKLLVDNRGKINYFIIHWSGNFRKGFKTKNNKVEMLDRKPFIQTLTNKLVHVISKDKQESYATKFLKKYCPEALKEPMALPIGKMLKKAKLKHYFAPLEDGAFGKIYFSDDVAKYYNDEDGGLVEGLVKRGTILVSESMAAERGILPFRNTMIHEMVHWYYHSNFFELRQLLNNELTCAVCFKKEEDYGDDEIEWMESQARTITPKILMPKKMFLQKFQEYFAEETNIAKSLAETYNKEYKNTDRLISIIKSLSDFFKVSKLSVKYRLIELGLHVADGVLNFNEDTKKYYKSYWFNPKSLKDHQTYFVDKNTFISILQSNAEIRQAVQEHKLIYSNALLVLNIPEFVTDGEINEHALQDVSKCCLKLIVSSANKPLGGDVNKFCLYKGEKRTSDAAIDSEQYKYIMSQFTEHVIHYNNHRKNMPSTVGATMQYHIKKKFEDERPHTEEVSRLCDISAKTLRSYLNDEVADYKFEIIIKFALGMELSPPYIEDLLRKASLDPNSTVVERAVLIATIRLYPRKNLRFIYRKLKETGNEEYLGLTSSYILKKI